MKFHLPDIIGLVHLTPGHFIMFAVAFVFFYIAIKKHYEPLLLVPIGFGILIANVPPIIIHGEPFYFTDVNNPNSAFYYIYYGILKGIYPPLIFLGIGAMTDFTPLISNPRLVLLGAAAQFGIFLAFGAALLLGFDPKPAGS